MTGDRAPQSLVRRARGAVAMSALLVACTADVVRAQAVPPAGGASPASMQRAEVATRTSMRRANGARLVKYTTLGAAAGAGMAMGYWAVSEKGMRGSNCKPLECALPFLTISGALAGLFLAHELEAQRIAVTPREGALARFATTETALLAPPTWAEVSDSLVVVATDSGVQVVATGSSKPAVAARRAAGLRAIRQVALVPGRGALSVGTASALWETPTMAGPARRIGDGAVSALAASDSGVLSAQGALLRLQRGEREDPTITDSLRVGGSVGAVAWDAHERLWWVATDSTLMAVTQDAGGLHAGNGVSIPGGARALTVGTKYVAVVLGDAGVVAFPRTSLRGAPDGGAVTPLRMVGEPRFAFDAAFAGDTLYVAGGVDGLFRVELSPTPRVIDSSRQFPFATVVRNQNGTIWVGDRGREAIVRIDR